MSERFQNRLLVKTHDASGPGVRINAGNADRRVPVQTPQTGLTYMASAEVTIAAKQMSVRIQHFNYIRPN